MPVFGVFDYEKDGRIYVASWEMADRIKRKLDYTEVDAVVANYRQDEDVDRSWALVRAETANKAIKIAQNAGIGQRPRNPHSLLGNRGELSAEIAAMKYGPAT